MDKTVKLKYSLFIELSTRADQKLISTLFEEEFSLTDNQEALNDGSIDLIIMDGHSVRKHQQYILELKEKFAPAFLPLLVLVNKKNPAFPKVSGKSLTT